MRTLGATTASSKFAPLVLSPRAATSRCRADAAALQRIASARLAGARVVALDESQQRSATRYLGKAVSTDGRETLPSRARYARNRGGRATAATLTAHSWFHEPPAASRATIGPGLTAAQGRRPAEAAVPISLSEGRRSSSDECRPRSTRGARIHAIALDRFVGCALPPGAFVPMHTMRSANRVALLVVVPSRHVVAAGWPAPTTRLRKRAGPVLRGADTFSAP